MSQTSKTDNNNEFLSDLKLASEMTIKGSIADAVSLSGELLAKAVEQFKHGQPDAIERIAMAGTIHIRSLSAAGENRLVFPTAIGLLTIITSSKDFNNATDNPSLRVAMLELTGNAISSLTTYVTENEATAPEDVLTHYRTILSMLVSVFYAWYRTVLAADPDCVVLPSAYLLLKNMIDEGVPVETPEISVGESKINPLMPAEAFADMVGRLKALGFEF